MKQLLTYQAFEDGTPFDSGQGLKYYRYLNGKIYEFSMDSDKMTGCLGRATTLFSETTITTECNKFAVEINHFGRYYQTEYFFSMFSIYEHPNTIPIPEKYLNK